jgi:hypothetical protein
MKWNVLYLLFFFSYLIVSCEKVDSTDTTSFNSDFTQTTTSSIVGSEYWADTSQDWQITNHRMECLVSKEYRKIHLLTRQLGTQDGDLEMKVRLGFFNDEISNLNGNWAGFSVGAKGRLVIHKDKTNYEKGINIGICTNGTLFIGAPSPNHKNETIFNALKTGVDLKVLIAFKNSGYTIDFSVLDIKSGKVLGHISKNDVATEQFGGELVLVSNFENSNTDKVNHKKSVWFKNWDIKGSKVKRTEALNLDGKTIVK